LIKNKCPARLQCKPNLLVFDEYIRAPSFENNFKLDRIYGNGIYIIDDLEIRNFEKDRK
jgi:hypothetical protein